MKKFILILAVLGVVTALYSQNDFNEWLAEQNKNYTSWKNQQDKDFTEFLSQSWDNFLTQPATVRDTIPKPGNIPNPVDQSCPDLMSGKKVHLQEISEPLPLTPDFIQEINHNQLLYALSEGVETLRIDYWGIKIPFNYNKNMKIEVMQKYDSSAIADFWGKISNTDYEMLLSELDKAKEQFVRNDWGYCQIIYKVGNELYQSSDMAYLFTWFVLTKSRYDCKIGYDNAHFYLLAATGSTIYEEPHLVLDGRDYYSLSLDNGTIKPVNLYTYEGSYPDANDLLDLNLESSPYLEEVIVERKLSFSYADSTWTFPVKGNLTLVEFLGSYPATDLAVYFQSELSPLAEKSLFEGLSPILEGRTETEALNILLRFVQTAFPYKTDAQQFGSENSLFPDETLYYEYCDCEDRSFLFSKLVEKFLGLAVIGLDFPGHIATAVEMKEDISGDKINYNGIDYLVCDPTYINADIGVIMPQFTDTEPKVIQFR
ncbi:MAG: hypothetical protein K9N06_02005 [Candidatus Cloacimonetes bacterium]|nr:hypothetical protein [Candidatus Cloacimonadota bacterium]